MYVKDSQIIERLLIPAIMLAVLISMQKVLEKDAAVLDPVKQLLDQALREPVADIQPDRVGKLVRRSKRSCTEAVLVVADKIIGLQYLAVAKLVSDLAERDVIIVGAESPFALAWDMMAEVMSLSWDIISPLDGEAEAASQAMLTVLERGGFFRG